MEYTVKRNIHASLCDHTPYLSYVAMFQMIQDNITAMMSEMNIDGVTTMRLYGAVWVFVRSNVRVIRRPAWRDDVIVKSYFTYHSAVKVMADTEINDMNGEPLIHARLEMCSLDISAGKIRKTYTVGLPENTECGAPLPELEFTRFPRGGFDTVMSFVPNSTNIDFCGHVNNVEYVRYIIGSYPVSELNKRQIKNIEMHYVDQSFENDDLEILRASSDNVDTLCVRKGDKITTECKLTFEE